MKAYKIMILQSAKEDIRHAVIYYNSRQKGLGNRFRKVVIVSVNTLRTNPFYQIRYHNIRVFKINKFPYLIHFYIDEDTDVVFILAIISTHQDTATNWLL